MNATVQACGRLAATVDQIQLRQEARALAFLASHGWTLDGVRYGALRRSGDFPRPQTGARLFIEETFPTPCYSRGCVRALVFRQLGLGE